MGPPRVKKRVTRRCHFLPKPSCHGERKIAGEKPGKLKFKWQESCR